MQPTSRLQPIGQADLELPAIQTVSAKQDTPAARADGERGADRAEVSDRRRRPARPGDANRLRIGALHFDLRSQLSRARLTGGQWSLGGPTTHCRIAIVNRF